MVPPEEEGGAAVDVVTAIGAVDRFAFDGLVLGEIVLVMIRRRA